MEWLDTMGPEADDEPMLSFERAAQAAGFSRIAGVDEAGRGPLAGPIVAAAVILGEPVTGLNDSKLLRPAVRESLFDELTNGPHSIGIEIIEASEIDAIGIQPANYAVMDRALGHIHPSPDFALVDGFTIKGSTFLHERIVKGDRRSFSIAAASIIAKVTRDRIMVDLDKRFPEYGFARHKGYGTKEHLAALDAHGPCEAHRRSFAPLSGKLETTRLFEVGNEGI